MFNILIVGPRISLRKELFSFQSKHGSRSPSQCRAKGPVTSTASEDRTLLCTREDFFSLSAFALFYSYWIREADMNKNWRKRGKKRKKKQKTKLPGKRSDEELGESSCLLSQGVDKTRCWYSVTSSWLTAAGHALRLSYVWGTFLTTYFLICSPKTEVSSTSHKESTSFQCI